MPPSWSDTDVSSARRPAGSSTDARRGCSDGVRSVAPAAPSAAAVALGATAKAQVGSCSASSIQLFAASAKVSFSSKPTDGETARWPPHGGMFTATVARATPTRAPAAAAYVAVRVNT